MLAISLKVHGLMLELPQSSFPTRALLDVER